MIAGLRNPKSLGQRLIDNLLSRSPYKIVPEWRLKDRYELAAHLRNVFRAFSVDCVIDVGANRGQFVRYLRANVGYHGWIVCFEPVSATYDALLKAVERDDRVVAVKFALGKSEGDIDINVTTDDSMSSFLQPRNRDVNLSNWSAVQRRETVKLKRLDDILPGLGAVAGAGNLYLKLDTQGYDLEVIAGAARSLKSVCALQTEVSVIPVYEGMPSWIASIQSLNAAGFDVSGMFPVTLDRNLRAIELDCVMINRAIAGPYEV